MVYLCGFFALAGLVLNLWEESEREDLMAGGVFSGWREDNVYLMDHFILPTIEGLAVGAREGSV